VRAGFGRQEKVFEGQELLRVDESHHALVGGGFGGEGQLLARLLADADAGLMAGFNEAGEAVVVALAGRQHVIEAAAAGAKRLLNGVQAIKNFHGEILEDEGGRTDEMCRMDGSRIGPTGDGSRRNGLVISRTAEEGVE
jgi:hypothetical protein